MNTGRIARRILAASEVLGYYGDCRTILDEGGVWEDLDAADMSNLVGKGQKVTREEFLALCESGVESAQKFADSAGRSYWYSADHHIAWIYDDDQDVHYFFGRL